MSRFTNKHSRKAGLPPGSLVHLGNQFSEETTIEVFEYSTSGFAEHKFIKNAIEEFEALPKPAKDSIRWINVDGLHKMDTIERVCKAYCIHPLVMEDILNTGHRPKIEDYTDYLYIITKMIYFEKDVMIDEQLSIIIGKGYVISFGEKEGDVFDQLRDLIRKNGLHIKKSGADYLAYSLLDAVVDGYFAVLETLGDKIDVVEEEFLTSPTKLGLVKMRDLKRELLFMHKSLWPLREVMSWLERSETSLINQPTQIYIRDVYDHIVQLLDTTETFRELLSGLMDIYLSSVSNRMNEIMKVLTIISTIFIPITFIVGLYGMNFHYMPELSSKFGYPAVLLTIVLSVVGMIYYFKKKKWF